MNRSFFMIAEKKEIHNNPVSEFNINKFLAFQTMVSVPFIIKRMRKFNNIPVDLLSHLYHVINH